MYAWYMHPYYHQNNPVIKASYNVLWIIVPVQSRFLLLCLPSIFCKGLCASDSSTCIMTLTMTMKK